MTAAPRLFRRPGDAAACALGLFLAGVAAVAVATPPPPQGLPQAARGGKRTKPARTSGALETVATFDGPMQTGVTVSRAGRVFVNFPRWGDPVPYTVAEVRNGRTVPYPDAALNRFDRADPSKGLVSVQSVVVDPRDRLWILDTGAPAMKEVLPGGAKLLCVDLTTDRVTKTIRFSPDVVTPGTYLNDIRFDLRQGAEGVAYVTDSGQKSPNGIIVVDLAAGTARRRLGGHPSVKPAPDFVPTVEGKPLMVRSPGQKPQPLKIGSDGIAISADGARLYYCPLASRHLYSVSTAALRDPNATDADVAKTVRDLGDKGGGSDGLESDDRGRVYLTDYEHAAVRRRDPATGRVGVLVQDPRLLWPDTLSVARDGYLYVSVNQLERQKQFHDGKDLRVKPYVLFRTKIDAGPVLLGGATAAAAAPNSTARPAP